MKITTLRVSIAMLALLVATPAFAALGLCEAAAPDGPAARFTTTFSADWKKEQNNTGTIWPLSGTTHGGSYQLACDCAPGTRVNVYYSTVSALTTTGNEYGYYRLNDNLAIKTEINILPGVAAALVPTSISSPIRDNTGSYSVKTNNSVCADDPAETRAAPILIGAEAMFTLYVTTPFLGELIIPETHIATLRAAWSDTTRSPKAFKDIAELYIQGSITVPQNCKINQGDTVQVYLGTISPARFTKKNQMPDGYTPVSFDISYDCGDMPTMKNNLFMEIKGTEVHSQYVLVGRRRASDNVPDVGIRMLEITNGAINIPFTSGQVRLAQSGTSKARFQAFPINLVGGSLAPGPFKGTATIEVIIR